MEISSAFAGTRLKPFTTQVDARQTMNYAAAVGDRNPCYFDDRRNAGLAAHPIFPAAITWNITGRIWEYLEAEDFPVDALLTQVHHTETIVHHRPLVPGDRLTIDGVIAAIDSHRSGTRVIIRYAAVDKNGQPVFTEYCGALLRGVTCVGGDRQVFKLPIIPAADTTGRSIWQATVDIDPLAAHIYDGCTDIVFPVHTSPNFAVAVGLPGIIYQGTATLALAVREIVDREADRLPSSIRTISGRFTGMVQPGSSIAIRLAGRRTPAGQALFFEVLTDDGQKAILNGYAKIINGSCPEE